MGIKISNRLVALLSLLVTVFFMGGCEREKGSKIKIGVAISSFDDQFSISIVDAMKAHVKKNYKNEVEISYVDGKDDAAKQLSQVENFVTQGMDAIIVSPVDTDATLPMTKLCLKEGIDIVYVNRKPRDLPEGSYYIGSEEKKAGILQMEYIAEQLGGKGNIAILMGDPTIGASHHRTDGVKEIAAKYPGIKISKIQTGKWKRALGMQVTENWISSGDKIDAIIANNDEMAIGAVSAVEASGLLGSIMIAGIDATPDALNYMAENKLDLTVFQDGKGQAEGAIDAAIKTSRGENVAQYNWIPFKLVTKENYKDFI